MEQLITPCPSCHKAFGCESYFMPIILSSCGHSICLLCVEILKQERIRPHCPVCNASVDNRFVRNHALIAQIQSLIYWKSLPQVMPQNATLKVEIYDSCVEKIQAHSVFTFRKSIKEITIPELIVESKSLLKRYYKREVKSLRIYFQVLEPPNDTARVIELDLNIMGENELTNSTAATSSSTTTNTTATASLPIPNGSTIILEANDFPVVSKKRSYFNFSLFSSCCSSTNNSNNRPQLLVSSSV